MFDRRRPFTNIKMYLGQIITVAFTFCPRWTLECDGAALSIQQYPALFALLGVIYGGNGQTTFNLPDLRGRVEVSVGAGKYLGLQYGSDTHVPATTTFLTLPSNASQCGAGSGTLYQVPTIPLAQPSLVVKKCIVTQGDFPSRD